MRSAYPPCPNPRCEKFGKQKAGNVVRRGRYGSRSVASALHKRRQRYKCNACWVTFSETKGSFTYRLRKPPSLVRATRQLRQRRVSLRKIARRLHVCVNTVHRWLTLTPAEGGG